MNAMRVVISRELPGDEHRRAFEDDVANMLAAAGIPVVFAPHIYHVPEDDALWAELARQPTVLLTWLHPRPAEWILRRHGLAGNAAAIVQTFGLGEFTAPADCCAAVMKAAGAAAGPASIEEIGSTQPEARWYPVIDGSRCVNCKQCMEFCLFGVYELDDAGKVFARHPDNCKNGCPACSRICPRGAIMFPLHEDPAIAGAPGLLMTPAPAMKAAFYKRTGRPCPLCGKTYRDATLQQSAGARCCTECGLPLDEGSGDDDGDELDSLIDDLERLR